MLTYFKSHLDSLLSLAIRVLSVLAGFGVAFYIGRQMGAHANGQYALVTQTAMFLSVIAVGGLDFAVVREFAGTTVRGIALNRKTLLGATGLALLLAGVIVLFLISGGEYLLESLFGNGLAKASSLILSIILISRTLTRLTSAVLRSQQDYLLSQIVEVLMIPAVVLFLLVIGVLRTIDQVLWCTASVGIITGLLGIAASLRFTGNGPDTLAVPMRRLLHSAAPLWGVAITLNISDWYGLTTVAIFLSVADAGVYRVAMQMGTVLSIVSMGLFAVFSAQISAAFAAGDRSRVAALCRSSTRLALLLVAPAAAILFLFAAPLLRFIGPEFEAGAPLLRIMAVAQVLATLSGPSGQALAMAGHGRINFLITATTTVGLIISLPLLAHFLGAIGVAIGVALVLVGNNAANLLFFWRAEGINSITGQHAART